MKYLDGSCLILSATIHYWVMQRSRSWQPSVTSVDVLRRMWQQGKDVSKRDEADESTVLHQAAEAGSRVLVWLLLKQGAEVNARDESGRTALHLACESYHRTTDRVVMLLLMYGAEINIQNTMGETCLHVACWAQNRELVILLVKSGASLELVDRNGLTPLHVVAHFKKSTSSIAEVLLEQSVDVNAVDSVGRSPLHWACSFEGIWIVNAILNKRGNVNLPDFQGDTPLHLACVGKERVVVTMLLKNGANISAKNNNNRTALHMAALHGSSDIIDVLLEHGADVRAEDSCGDTPLHLAVSWVTKSVCIKRNHLIDVIKPFLKVGANIDVKNELKRTPFDEMVEFEARFCARDYESAQDKAIVTKLTDLFIEHVFKLKTANIPVDVDITNRLGSVKYDILQMLYGQEIRNIKCTYLTKSLSLIQVFSHDEPYLLSDDEIGLLDDYLKASDLLDKFPLYGDLLRNTFQRSKLLTQDIPCIDEDGNDENYSKVAFGTSPSECDLQAFIRTEREFGAEDITFQRLELQTEPYKKEVNNEEDAQSSDRDLPS